MPLAPLFDWQLCPLFVQKVTLKQKSGIKICWIKKNQGLVGCWLSIFLYWQLSGLDVEFFTLLGPVGFSSSFYFFIHHNLASFQNFQREMGGEKYMGLLLIPGCVELDGRAVWTELLRWQYRMFPKFVFWMLELITSIYRYTWLILQVAECL